jgi:T-complex protein 1 subunit eta
VQKERDVLQKLCNKLKAERDNAEIRIADVAAYQKIVDAEWDIIYDKLAKIHKSGANIVLSKLPIGDLATQYFADRGMFCTGRVEHGDIMRMQKAIAGKPLTRRRPQRDESHSGYRP